MLQNRLMKTPNGFQAFDPDMGSVHWRIEMDSPPGLQYPGFSIKQYYNPRQTHFIFQMKQQPTHRGTIFLV